VAPCVCHADHLSAAQSIPAAEYVRLFGEGFNPAYLGHILTIWDAQLVDGSVDAVAESVVSLTRVRRFDVATVFLSKTDKAGECLRIHRCSSRAHAVRSESQLHSVCLTSCRLSSRESKGRCCKRLRASTGRPAHDCLYKHDRAMRFIRTRETAYREGRRIVFVHASLRV
jgi:hypothetical protein